MKNINLTKESVKTIGISFSYNKTIQNESKFTKAILKKRQF